MSFPYLDLPGFQGLSLVPSSDVALVEQVEPGFTARRIVAWSSWINARLRKRYGSPTALPFGQGAPALVPAGAAPPAVSLQGRPVLGSMRVQLFITAGGPVGTAVFKWSADGGTSFTTGVVTAPTVPLTGTGLSAIFAPGTYATDCAYAAAPPVPDAVLGWLVALVSVDVMRKRGVNSQDPLIKEFFDEATTAKAEVKEAADSKDGLFDLPSSEDQASAIVTGGPLGCSDTSPYAWQDRQAREGYAQDAQSIRGGR